MALLLHKYFHLIFNIFILYGINISKIMATDCEVLSRALQYYNNKKYKQSFEKLSNCCNVEGIFCDEDQRFVTGIFFTSSPNSSKSITNAENFFEELGNLNNLESIELYGITIGNKKIPSEIGKMQNLKSLDLSSNKLEGPIPKEIGNLVNLQSLSLYDNSLSGSIPNELTNLKNLEILNLSKNQLEGYIPYEFRNLDKLKTLQLGENEKLKGYIPPLENINDCYFEETNLCSLKYAACYGSILCYAEEIEDTNKNNGNPNINEYKDRAIKDESERNVTPGVKKSNSDDFFEKLGNAIGKYIVTIIVIVIIVGFFLCTLSIDGFINLSSICKFLGKMCKGIGNGLTSLCKGIGGELTSICKSLCKCTGDKGKKCKDNDSTYRYSNHSTSNLVKENQDNTIVIEETPKPAVIHTDKYYTAECIIP